jgi:hypothetical protein
VSDRTSRDGRNTVSTGRAWERQHADGIVAQVIPVDGIGTWRICARYTGVPERSESDSRHYTMLVDAHAAVDALARDAFDHSCGARCGNWHQVDRRRADDSCID